MPFLSSTTDLFSSLLLLYQKHLCARFHCNLLISMQPFTQIDCEKQTAGECSVCYRKIKEVRSWKKRANTTCQSKTPSKINHYQQTCVFPRPSIKVLIDVNGCSCMLARSREITPTITLCVQLESFQPPVVQHAQNST